MLIDDPQILKSDPILAMIGAINGNTESKRLLQGIYQITHFRSSDFPGPAYYQSWNAGWEERKLSISDYGVCDNYQQVLEQCPELDHPDRKFVLTLTQVRKLDQPTTGGWRWHKWGEYIGIQNPQHEYLVDEEGIEQVLCYSIHERKPEK